MNRDEPIATLRKNHKTGRLLESEIETDPIKQFVRWFKVAQQAQLYEPNAMNLATIHGDGRLSSRMVLLKAVDERGFVFYTNYDSDKAQALESNHKAALCFWWDALERQVRVEGQAERVSAEESDAYFATRPLGSRIGAMVSKQSAVLENYALLEQQYARLQQQLKQDEDTVRPDYWGGYCVRPEIIEFWQGRPSRLHDRLCYRRDKDGHWQVKRLYP